ncbi:DNA-methyltransferase [Thioflexithrix psekupsensis]|uniref:Methyltransferase n=1 Tax=Thioflexithrix psekupsensis TaxID=1570016 RepID=A0A251XBJ7_9GAMM|nr:site-specific DNA-methyltransferase [Thioflexithrix psekupsensis]OUD15673.1 restriction endonuclease [Thioflexithrix psekupsensis]
MVESFINKIHQGDCLDLFKQLPDNSVDMTFADPPFNLKKGYKSYKDSLDLKKYLDWCERWILEMVRVTKPTGSIYLHNIPKWLTYYAGFLNEIADFKHWISWDAPTMPMGKTLQPNHYGILFYAKNAKTLKFYEVRYPHKRDRKTSYLSKDYGGKKAGLHPFGSLLSDVWTDIHRIKHNKYRDEHPCQLPVHLLERLILMSTDANDIVLDPFNGTGTTALAAKRLGRQFIGFELDQEYVEITKNKLTQEQANSKLGNCWVSFYLGKVITLRDCDWDELKEYFIIPSHPEEIDYTPIVLKTETNIISPPKIQKENQSLQLFDVQS